MNVSALEWGITLSVTIAILLFDVVVIGRRPHEPSKRETGTALGIYVGLAIAFGVWIWFFHGSQYGVEFFAGWLTEYSLSVDNLFVFVIIMARFAVPREQQQRVLMVGIIVALVLRGAFILAGAAIISQFVWVFYLFGAFLVYTAVKLVAGGDEPEEYHENRAVRALRRVLPIGTRYDGGRLRTGVFPPPKVDQPEPDNCRRAIQRLAELRPDTIAFGHGPPLVTDAAHQLSALAAALR